MRKGLCGFMCFILLGQSAMAALCAVQQKYDQATFFEVSAIGTYLMLRDMVRGL